MIMCSKKSNGLSAGMKTLDLGGFLEVNSIIFLLVIILNTVTLFSDIQGSLFLSYAFGKG